MKNKNTSKGGIVRVTVDLSAELYSILENLEASTTLSKSALLRNAVKLQSMLLNEVKKGNEIIVHDVKKKRDRELILM